MSKLKDYSVDSQGLVRRKSPKPNTVLTKIRLKPQASTIKIIVNNNIINIESDGYFMCMDIRYTGNISINYSNIPEGWVVNQGLGRILIYAFSDKDTPEFSFGYTGAVDISKVEWANAVDDKKYYAKIEKEKMNYWNKMKVNWNNATSNYNDLSSGSKISSRITHTKVKRTRMIPIYKGGRK